MPDRQEWSWKQWRVDAVRQGAGTACKWPKGPRGWTTDIWAGEAPSTAQQRADKTLEEWEQGP